MIPIVIHGDLSKGVQNVNNKMPRVWEIKPLCSNMSCNGAVVG